MKLETLRNKHAGTDIYVIGSGATLGFIDSTFFENKVVVCVNHTIRHIPYARHLYLVAKEPTKSMQQNAHDRKATIVMCRHHSGIPSNPENRRLFPDETAIFNARQNAINNPKQLVSLERSSSTIVSGIHLAAFMGAKTIILVGHDCGWLDGKSHVDDYSKEKGGNEGRSSLQKMDD